MKLRGFDRSNNRTHRVQTETSSMKTRIQDPAPRPVEKRPAELHPIRCFKISKHPLSENLQHFSTAAKTPPPAQKETRETPTDTCARRQAQKHRKIKVKNHKRPNDWPHRVWEARERTLTSTKISPNMTLKTLTLSCRAPRKSSS